MHWIPYFVEVDERSKENLRESVSQYAECKFELRLIRENKELMMSNQ